MEKLKDKIIQDFRNGATLTQKPSELDMLNKINELIDRQDRIIEAVKYLGKVILTMHTSAYLEDSIKNFKLEDELTQILGE